MILLLAKFLPSNRGKYTPVVTGGQVIVRNKGLTTATITWVYEGETSSQSLARGQVLYLPERVKIGEAVNTVYESIQATYSNDHTVNFNVTQEATALTMYECTDKVSPENTVVVTVINGTNHPVQVHAVSADNTSYSETITLPQYGLINLPNDVPAGSQVDSTYSSITASWNGVTHFVADLAVVPSQEPWQDHVITVEDQVAECALSIQNKSTQALTVNFQEVGSESAIQVELVSGETFPLPKRIQKGQSIDTVYSLLSSEYSGGTPVAVDVTQVLNGNLALTRTDVEPVEGSTIVGLRNAETDMSMSVTYMVEGDQQEYEFLLPAQGVVSLPNLVPTGGTLYPTYTKLAAFSGETLVWKADFRKTFSGAEEVLNVTKGTYYKVTLDMNGNSVTAQGTGDPITFSYPIWVKEGEGLSDSIGNAVYEQGNTYVPDTPAHAADGQYGFYNGCTYDNGAAKYPFPEPPTEDVDLVCHTTYGYWSFLHCDCYEESVGYPGCSGVTNKAGELIQYKWDDIVNALHEKYPNRTLVAVWTSDQKTTQVSFSETTVDYVEGNWSEQVAPDYISGTSLYLETQVSE